MSTQVADPSPGGLRLLSIDAGGIRGLSALLILREVLYRIQQQQRLAEVPRPCDVFDLAGGTGTGGIIAIMLFRLRMGIDHAINVYAELSRFVFSEKQSWPLEDAIFKASRLERAMISIMSSLEMEEVREIFLLDQGGPKCFVCALPMRNMILPTLFRSWLPSANRTYNCTVLEAVRATSAETSIFEKVEIGDPGQKEAFIGGCMGTYNPSLYVVNEAKALFPNHRISCLLSLGTSVKAVTGMSGPPDLTTTRLIDIFGRIAIDCEATSENTARYFSDTENVYFRLSAEERLQGERLSEWEELPVAQTYTDQYLTQYEVVKKVDQLVRVLNESLLAVPVEPAAIPPPKIELSAAERRVFKDLKATISIDALHGSQANSTCHPGTRKVQIGSIMNWIEERGPKPLFVVLGPAGSGKSCLLSTVAQICKDNGSYAAGFFFSRDDPERNTSARLINTIVYQLCEAIPDLIFYVTRVVEREANILSRSLHARLHNLLFQPLREFRSDHPNVPFRPRVIIIDAVDECDDEDEQRRVIAIIIEALSSESFPFLCIFSSRFNRLIEGVLSCNALSHIGVTFGLAEAEDMKDIRSYLDDKMKDIRNKHPSGAQLSEGWPSLSDIQTIVKRSGGQFIYAKAVVSYVESPYHDPQDRLEHIVTLSPQSASAFEVLDELYRDLMFSIKALDVAAEVLGIGLLGSSSRFWAPKGSAYQDFVKGHFEKLDADTILTPLAPVLKYQDNQIKVYHPSFTDFLFDRARSREYYVNPKKWQEWSVSRLVQLFYDKGTHAGDVDYLIRRAKPGTELHQFINAGLELVIDHPKRLPTGGDFNIWPLVTEAFFWRLRFGIWVEKIAMALIHQRKGFIVLPVLIKLAAAHKLSNSFVLFELCRTIAALKAMGFIQESDKDWRPDPDGLLRCVVYLADFFQDQHRYGRKVLMPEDYHFATLRCLWYLHNSRRSIHSSLREQLQSIKYLPSRFGIPRYLKDSSSNITRGILEVLFSVLPRSPPSVDLFAALNKPFDNEVISMNPSLCQKAKGLIHEYLKHNDPDYEGKPVEEPDKDEDEPLPHFKWFLVQEDEQ